MVRRWIRLLIWELRCSDDVFGFVDGRVCLSVCWFGVAQRERPVDWILRASPSVRVFLRLWTWIWRVWGVCGFLDDGGEHVHEPGDGGCSDKSCDDKSMDTGSHDAEPEASFCSEG